MVRIKVGRARVSAALEDIKKIQSDAKIDKDSIVIPSLREQDRMQLKLRLSAAGLGEWATYLDS